MPINVETKAFIWSVHLNVSGLIFKLFFTNRLITHNFQLVDIKLIKT